MEIKIKDDNCSLTITDENLDNDNFVSLSFKEDEDGEVILSIEELATAFKVFNDFRISNLQRNEKIR